MLFPAPRRRVVAVPPRRGKLLFFHLAPQSSSREAAVWPKMQLCLPALQEQGLWLFATLCRRVACTPAVLETWRCSIAPSVPWTLAGKRKRLAFSVLIYTVGHLEHLETCILTESVFLLSTHDTPWTHDHVGQRFLFRAALRLTLSESDVDSDVLASTLSPEVCVLFGQ